LLPQPTQCLPVRVAHFQPPYMKTAPLISCIHFTHTKETIMTITHAITADFMPRDVHQRRYRYWPSPRQRPRLEQPRPGFF